MQRLRRLILGSRPSPLELIVGRDNYDHEYFVGGSIFLGSVCAAVLAALALEALPGPQIGGFHRAAVFALVAPGLVAVLVAVLFGRNWRFEVLLAIVLPMVPMVIAALWLAGPNIAESTGLLPIAVATAVVYQPRRVAFAMSVSLLTMYGVMLALADGYPLPLARWVLVAGYSAAAAGIMEFLFRHLNVLSQQVAAANRVLESRVTEQGGEIERLGQLRRFLTPQIAESVLSGDADSLLATHRKRIAVFFCDLRGFTRFSMSAEPEDIAEVLTEYYETLGRANEQHNATLGGFPGDGISAFFNDPFPIEDPAGKAFAMALSLREPMRAMRATWERRGFSLSYGLGIAYGYATMSTIGFESRSEYTAVGSVVNLGARLCDAAAPGELLIDARAYNELPQDVAGEQRQLMLKGFNDPVTAYRVWL
jgi:adenylate cyclase